MLDETVSKSTQRWKSILYTKGPLFESFFAKAEFWPITQILFQIFLRSQIILIKYNYF